MVDFLLNFSLKSITFQKGMSRVELIAFLELMAQLPGIDGNQRGAALAALEEQQVTHIILNQKVYIAKDQDSQLLASLDIKDEEIVRYMAEAYPDQDFDIDKIQSMAQDEAWVATIFHSGMKQIMKDQGVVSGNLLTQSMMRMFTVLDKVTSLLDQGKICRLIAKSIADLDPEIISLILSQDMNSIFGGELFQQIIDQLDIEKMEQVALQMQVTDQEQAAVSSADRKSMNDAHQRLLATEKGGEMQQNIAARQLAELTEQERDKIRLQGDELWYYVRNLAYLMGKVGTESSAHVLQPLLLHKNNRVREEALKSLHRTGGANRGPLMMSVLPAVDDEFKLNIIETLGSIKYIEAVPTLLDMLKERPLVASAPRIELEEKICTILGKIGSGKALAVLKEISQPKLFSLSRKYPEKVRKAAARALGAIEVKQADEARKARR